MHDNKTNIDKNEQYYTIAQIAKMPNIGLTAERIRMHIREGTLFPDAIQMPDGNRDFFVPKATVDATTITRKIPERVSSVVGVCNCGSTTDYHKAVCRITRSRVHQEQKIKALLASKGKCNCGQFKRTGKHHKFCQKLRYQAYQDSLKKTS